MKYAPATVHDEINDDVLPEVVAVLEHKPHRALSVWIGFSVADLALSLTHAHTFGIVAVNV